MSFYRPDSCSWNWMIAGMIWLLSTYTTPKVTIMSMMMRMGMMIITMMYDDDDDDDDDDDIDDDD